MLATITIAITSLHFIFGGPLQTSIQRHNNKKVTIQELYDKGFCATRTKNALAASGITTIGDLVGKSEKEILCTKNLGRRRFQDTKELVEAFGFRLSRPYASEDNPNHDLEVIKLRKQLRVNGFNIL